MGKQIFLELDCDHHPFLGNFELVSGITFPFSIKVLNLRFPFPIVLSVGFFPDFAIWVAWT